MILCPIAGHQFRSIDDQVAYSRLETGAQFTLIPEPDNPYDENAIKVYDDHGHHLGYVPRKHAAELVDVVDDLRAVWNGFEMEITIP